MADNLIPPPDVSAGVMGDRHTSIRDDGGTPNKPYAACREQQRTSLPEWHEEFGAYHGNQCNSRFFSVCGDSQRCNCGLDVKLERLHASLTEAQAENARLKAWRSDATVALLRPGGAHYEDVPKHVKEMRSTLSELHEMVRGECPSLLNEDSGGDATLALRIERILGRDGAQ